MANVAEEIGDSKVIKNPPERVRVCFMCLVIREGFEPSSDAVLVTATTVQYRRVTLCPVGSSLLPSRAPDYFFKIT